MTDCRLGWLYLIEFIDKVNSFYDLVRKVDIRYQLKLMDSVSGSPAKTVLDWAEKTGIKSQLKKCTEGSCNFETTKNICDNFVSIDQPLYLQEALRIVDEVTKKISKAKELLENIKAKLREFTRKIGKGIVKGFTETRKYLSIAKNHVHKFAKKAAFKVKEGLFKSGKAVGHHMKRAFSKIGNAFKKIRIGRKKRHNKHKKSRRGAAPKPFYKYMLTHYNQYRNRPQANNYNTPVKRYGNFMTKSPLGFKHLRHLFYNRWRKGRKLLVKLGSKQPTPRAPAQPKPSTLCSEQSASTADQATINPLLCGRVICIADKVIMTASKCGSVGIQCTKPDVSYP